MCNVFAMRVTKMILLPRNLSLEEEKALTGITTKPHSLHTNPRKGPGAKLVKREKMRCGWGSQGELHTRWHLNTKKDRNGMPDLDKD